MASYKPTDAERAILFKRIETRLIDIVRDLKVLHPENRAVFAPHFQSIADRIRRKRKILIPDPDPVEPPVPSPELKLELISDPEPIPEAEPEPGNKCQPCNGTGLIEFRDKGVKLNCAHCNGTGKSVNLTSTQASTIT